MPISQTVLARLLREAVSRSGPLSADEQNALSSLDQNFTADGYVTSEVLALIAAVSAAVSAANDCVAAAQAVATAFDEESEDLTGVIGDLSTTASALSSAISTLDAARDIAPSEGGV